MSEASRAELGLMLLTSLVPLLVPSLFHSSTPRLPSFAPKKSVLPTSVMSSTHELPAQLFSLLQASVVGTGAARLMSLTSLVPFLVPSLFHSSTPCLPSFALKNIVSPTSVMSSTHELPAQSFLSEQASLVGAGAAVLMFLTSLVPLLVPSVFHSSTPCLPSSAAKNTCLPMTVTVSGWLQPLGIPQSSWSQRAPGRLSGLMSLTSLVPLSVPSVFHSSSP